MAHLWLGILAFLLQFFFSYPRCTVCSNECEQPIIAKGNFVNITITCDENDLNTMTFLETNETNLNSVKLTHPLLSNLDLSNLSSAKIVNFSGNELTAINISALQNVRSLNLSHNNLTGIEGNLTKLNSVDLSYNSISDISKFQILSANITFISLNNNLITSVKNFSIKTLEHLDLRNNQITVLSLGKNPNLKILNLNNNSIVKIINASLLPSLEVLNLSSNALRQLNNSNFNLTNLLKLDLKNNNLRHLSPKCFIGLNKLQFLDISQNHLSMVFPSTLQYLSSLIQLIISENTELSSQDFGLLLASKRLKSVNASKTNQKKIPSSLIRSVRYLFLSFNNITQIQCGDLDSYPLLNNLDLSYNNISYVEDDALGRLELLTKITLNHNALVLIPYTLPTNLRILLINNNLITKITTTDFLSITQLKQLDLSNNKITTIAEGSFSQLLALQRLNLSGNNIQILSSSIFSSQQNLRILDLSFLTNVTKCDQALCFPVPESNELQELNLQNSPLLVKRLLNDAAALKTFRQLNILNLANANLSEIRTDLPNHFPRLRFLHLDGNELNCSLIISMYTWLDVKETEECIFTMTEIVTTTITSTSTTEFTTEAEIINTMSKPISNTISNLFLDFDLPVKNITELPSTQSNDETTKSDSWYKESDLGIVDAYEGTTPTSHPGLFILLLLPVALVSTCLVLHYSRSRRQIDNERQCEMDIEISNISSELW